jgi:hypothetical protein
MAIVDATAEGPIPDVHDLIWMLADGFGALVVAGESYRPDEAKSLHGVTLSLLEAARRLGRKPPESLLDAAGVLRDSLP